jgi:hypothetical protein
VPPSKINPNSDPGDRIAYLLKCVSSAGFDSLDEAYATYLTTRFPPGECQQAQTKSWLKGGVRDVIVKAGNCELSGSGYKKMIKEDFKIGVYTVAQKLYEQEFTKSQASRQGQELFLNVAAANVTEEMLTQDTIGKLKALFLEKVPRRVHVWLENILVLLDTLVMEPPHLFSPKGGSSPYGRCGPLLAALQALSWAMMGALDPLLGLCPHPVAWRH